MTIEASTFAFDMGSLQHDIRFFNRAFKDRFKNFSIHKC